MAASTEHIDKSKAGAALSTDIPRATRILVKVKAAILAVAVTAIAATAVGVGIAQTGEWIGILGLACMLAATCSILLIAVASRFLGAGRAIR